SQALDRILLHRSPSGHLDCLVEETRSRVRNLAGRGPHVITTSPIPPCRQFDRSCRITLYNRFHCERVDYAPSPDLRCSYVSISPAEAGCTEGSSSKGPGHQLRPDR